MLLQSADSGILEGFITREICDIHKSTFNLTTLWAFEYIYKYKKLETNDRRKQKIEFVLSKLFKKYLGNTCLDKF